MSLSTIMTSFTCLTFFSCCSGITEFRKNVNLNRPAVQRDILIARNLVTFEMKTAWMDKKDHSFIKPWYAEIRKQLRSHFRSVESIQNAAYQRGETEAIFLKRLNETIFKHLDEEKFGVVCLAQELAMSRSQLFRKTKRLTQMSPVQYIRFVKLTKAKEMLETRRYTISQVAFKTGFASLSHFSRAFKGLYGFSPSQL